MVKLTLKIVAALLLAYLLFVAVSCILPPLARKELTAAEQVEIQASLDAPSSDAERVLCIDQNTEALLWRLRAIEAAQQEIILSTFDFDADEGGRDILSALLQAADRGVEVKLLVDGLSGFLDVERKVEFRALAASPQVEIKIYNPISLLTPWTANYRLHDKYLIVDDWLYILGGRNTGNLFLGNYQQAQNIDRDILVYTDQPDTHTSLQQVKAYFGQVWSLEESRVFSPKTDSAKVRRSADELREHYLSLQTTYPQAFQDTDWAAATLPAERVQLLSGACSAGNKAPAVWYALCQIMEDGQDILIQTPYVVCSQAMYQDLTQLSSAERQVRILTNAVENGANPFGCSDYLNQKQNILATGADVYEYIGAQSLHTKTILVDDRLSIVGSYNLDMRSTYLDTELMLVIDCPELNAALRSKAAEDIAQSKLVLSDGTQLLGPAYEPPSLPLSKRIGYTVLRVLTIPLRHLL